MKIMFLVSSLQFGGAERVATVLCNEFSAKHQVSLVATYGGTEPCVFELDSRINLHYLASGYPCFGGQKNGSFARLSKLRYLIKKDRPDVIISFLPNVNVMAVLANIGLNTPLIICERSDPEHFPMSGLWKFLCRYSYQYADMLTVQTSVVAEKVNRLFRLPALVEVVPNPIAKSLLEVKPVLDRQNKHILCLGRLTASKQFDQIISAFAQVSTIHQDWELHIIGDGPVRQSLENQARELGIAEKVRFFGGVEQPFPQIAVCDVFAMASKFEGFPNALLEALALGRATVVYDCPSGPAEMTEYGKVGLLVPLNDHRQFVDALTQLIVDSELRLQLGEAAQASVFRRYSLSAVVDIWYQLIEKAQLNRRQSVKKIQK